MTWDNFLDITADSYGLSDRQKQVFITRFSDQGANDSNARIATKLQLSEQDVERALREIYNLFRDHCPELASRTRGQSEKLRKWLKQKYAETRQGFPNPISVIAPVPQPVAASATLNTTPPSVGEWQGRQEEINELQTALSNDKVRLIGMTAAGGYGKSALAVKFTQQLTPDWRVLWVSFIQPYPLAQFGRWLLEQLGRAYDEKWDEETLIGQIIAGLIAEPCLLVLDNMETVIPAEGKSVYGQFLSQWLGNGGNSKLLLTSREQPTLAPNLQPRCYWLALKGLSLIHI